MSKPIHNAMDLLFVADRLLPDASGGAQTVAWELASGLAERGHRVTLLAASKEANPTEWETRGDNDIALARYRGGSLQRMIFGGTRALSSVVTRRKIECVHSHFAYAELGPQIALSPTMPWVRTFHGPWDEEGWLEDSQGRHGYLLKARTRRWLRRWLERRSLAKARRIVVLSEYARDLAIACGAAPGKLRVIPGGTDLKRFHPGSRELASPARSEGSQEGPRLFTLRRLAPRMGLKTLVRAMHQVRQALPTAQLMIGGCGPEKDALEALIKELGLNDAVTLQGFIPEEQLADHYRAADLFVLPTAALEGFGLVTVDALACGTPVLGTPVGATAEILGPLDRRLLTAGTNAGDLAEGIIAFWKGEWRNELTPARLHAYARERYAWDRHVTGMLTVYEEALDPR